MEQKSDDQDITFNFPNKSILTIYLKEKKFNKIIEQDTDFKLQSSNTNSFLKRINYDSNSVKKLESIIRNSINYHQEILKLANLPQQIDIEFLRTNKLEQFIHSLSWNKIKEPYAQSKQVNLNNKDVPVIRIATDFVKNFNEINFDLNWVASYNNIKPLKERYENTQ